MIMALISTDDISTLNTKAIDEMLERAMDENRNDIISRLIMLKFVVETEIENQAVKVNAEEMIAGIAAEEKKYRMAAGVEKIGRRAVKISIGTAIASGSIYAASALISNDYYRKYTETEYEDQAAFYLFWWQLLEQVSIISAVTALVSSSTAGILSAVF
jgi:hypothetical protein